MKVIIAGSRTITDYNIVKKAITDSKFTITEVVSGGAYGIDRLGERWAKENKIPIKVFLPDWTRFGKSAGYKRNVEMSNYGEALIIIIENNSKGSVHMYNIAKEKNMKIFRVDI